MKKILLPFLFSILFFNFLFAQKTMDKNLVGFWSSTIEKTKEDPIDGTLIMNRKNDGTFILYFELINNKDSIYTKEGGKWWTENGNYYEVLDRLKYDDVYTYKQKNDQIYFSLVNKKSPVGFRAFNYKEEKTKDLTDYYEDKYSIFMAKSMKKMFEMDDKINGFSYDQTDGVQDARFVGVWKGSEKDNQVKGLSKEWTMTRNADGTFILDFKTKMKGGKTDGFIEKGKWWVKDNKFYEYHEDSDMTDVYNFDVLNEKQIKFKAISISVEQENEEYEFIDTKVK